MRFSILTLFPEYFQSPLGSSLLGRARAAGLVSFDFINLRDFGEGKYRAVDDKPYGGGAGMVMMPEVFERAFLSLLGSKDAVDRLEHHVRASRESEPETEPESEFESESETQTQTQSQTRTLAEALSQTPHVVYLSPQGRPLTAATARRLSAKPHLVLLCGHYEGIDERVSDAFVHEEVSIGDFILTGGEPAAAVLIDAVSRFVPGVVGEEASVAGDTFEAGAPDMNPGGLKYPMFTRPAVWRGRAVPEILTSGNHGAIAKWRKAQSEERTAARRPDLYVPPPPPKPKKSKRAKK